MKKNLFLSLLTFAMVSCSLFNMNNEFDYDLDDNTIYGDDTTTIQAAIRGYLERKKYTGLQQEHDGIITIQSLIKANQERKNITNLKHKTLSLQNLIRGTTARKDFNTDTVIKLQSLIRGNQNRKNFETTKNSIVTLQSLMRGNKEREDYKTTQKNNNLRETLMQRGTTCYSNFKEQVKNIVINLAKSVENENDIEQQTTKLINDIQQGSEIVYCMNFADENSFSWNDIIDANIDPVNAYIKVIQQVCSFYYYINAQQRSDKVGFTEGTFFIETTNDRWKTFFDKLSTQVQISKRPSAYYKRTSSHDLGETGYGMDFRSSESNDYDIWLYRFKTLLISQTEHGIWIKPEHYGCYYWLDIPVHLKGWFTSQKGKIINKDYYNKPEWNKERTPAHVITAFKKLFPDYNGGLTLGAMYTHALTNKQKAFAQKLKIDYSNISHRQGCECYVDYACLLESFFVKQNKNTELLGLYAYFNALKQTLSEKNKETITHAYTDLKTYYNVLKKELPLVIKDYFEHLLTVIASILEQKDGLTVLSQEPIFEIEFQKEFLMNEEQKKLKEEKLKKEATIIMERDAQKIKLAQDLQAIVVTYCEKAHTLLDNITSETILNKIKNAPHFQSAESTKLQLYLSTNKLENLDEAFGVDDCYNKNLFAATHNLNNDTTGLRKITELRLFKYTSNNPYVPEYHLEHMQCIKELAVRICATAWSIKEDANDDNNIVIFVFKTLLELWNTTLEDIYARLEKEGYSYNSKTGKGKEITDAEISNAQTKIEAIKQQYQKIAEDFAETIKNNKNLKESNQQRFIKKYNELAQAVIKDLDFNMTEIFAFIGIRMQVAKTEDELISIIKQSIDNILRLFDWNNPMIYTAQKLKLFENWAGQELKKEEHQENLLESQWGENMLNNFEKNN